MLILCSSFLVSKNLTKYEGYINNKSFEIMIDNDKNSESYNQKFAKGLFEIKFKIIELYNYDLAEFGTENIINPKLKSEFTKIEMEYSKIKFKILGNNKNRYLMFFNSWVNIKNIVNEIKSFKSVVKFFYCDNTLIKCFTPNEKSLKTYYGFEEITDYSINDDTDLINVGINDFKLPSRWRKDYHKKGFNWHIFSMRMPMVWDISEGDSNIFIGFDDVFSSDDPGYKHREMDNFKK